MVKQIIIPSIDLLICNGFEPEYNYVPYYFYRLYMRINYKHMYVFNI